MFGLFGVGPGQIRGEPREPAEFGLKRAMELAIEDELVDRRLDAVQRSGVGSTAPRQSIERAHQRLPRLAVTKIVPLTCGVDNRGNRAVLIGLRLAPLKT